MAIAGFRTLANSSSLYSMTSNPTQKWITKTQKKKKLHIRRSRLDLSYTGRTRNIDLRSTHSPSAENHSIEDLLRGGFLAEDTLQASYQPSPKIGRNDINVCKINFGSQK